MVKKSGNKKTGKRKASVPTRIMVFINLFIASLLLLSLLASRVSPADFWPLAFAGIAYPYFLILNLFFVLFWLVFLKKYFVISLIVILAGYNQFTSLIRIKSVSDAQSPAGSFKVMSYNVRLFDLYNWKNQTKASTSKGDILKMINDENVDILCLQEYYSGNRNAKNYAESVMEAGNLKYYFDAYIDNGKKVLPFGLATFSKYPILSGQKINFLNTYQNYCILTDILVNRDTIRVINTHLESIKFGKEDYIFVNELANNKSVNNDLREGTRAILRKMKRAYIKRSGQAEQLAGIVAASPHKVVLCADFNDTPASFAYRKIASTHTDAFREAGTGFGQTYPQLLPMLRIDYIFIDKQIQVLDYKTIKNRYSDHYPIIATIQL